MAGLRAAARPLREPADLDPLVERVGFRGLDVYRLWDPMHELVGWLREHGPEHVLPPAHAT